VVADSSEIVIAPCKSCVCRVCVADEFYALYAFRAIVESVSYGIIDGQKVQVPPPAFRNNLLIRAMRWQPQCGSCRFI
jgi:hypothetical protein